MHEADPAPHESDAPSRFVPRGGELEPFPRFRARIEKAVADTDDVAALKSALTDVAARRNVLRIESLCDDTAERHALHAEELQAVEVLIDSLADRLEARKTARGLAARLLAGLDPGAPGAKA